MTVLLPILFPGICAEAVSRIETAAAVCAGAAVYGVALAAFGFFSKKEFVFVRSFLGSQYEFGR